MQLFLLFFELESLIRLDIERAGVIIEIRVHFALSGAAVRGR